MFCPMRRIQKLFAIADKVLRKIEGTCLILAMTLITGLISAQVILRYVFNDSLHWAEELARFLVVWMSFIGASMGMSLGSHVSMEVLKNLPYPQFVIWVARFGHSMCILLSIYLIIYGSQQVQTVMIFGQVSSALRVPMWTVYACLPICGLLFFIRSVQALIATWLEDFAKGDNYESDVVV